MKKAFAAVLPILFGAGLLYGLVPETMLSLSAYGVPQEQSDKDDAEGPKDYNEQAPPHHHDDSRPPGPDDTHAAEEEGREHDNQDQEDNSFLGSDISQERYIIASDEMMRQIGSDPPHRPYWSRLKELHQMVEERGYKREELFDIYRLSVWTRAAPAIAGIELPPDERKRFQRSLEESKTMRLVQLFESQEHEAIEEWIKDRLSKNGHDIPALYVRLHLNYSVFSIDELLDTVEEMIVALDHFESSRVPKEAILYEILAIAMHWGSLRESGIESLKQRSRPDELSGFPHWLLFAMELAGDW